MAKTGSLVSSQQKTASYLLPFSSASSSSIRVKDRQPTPTYQCGTRKPHTVPRIQSQKKSSLYFERAQLKYSRSCRFISTLHCAAYPTTPFFPTTKRKLGETRFMMYPMRLARISKTRCRISNYTSGSKRKVDRVSLLMELNTMEVDHPVY